MSHTTHRQKIARPVAKSLSISYARVPVLVDDAATAGVLPTRLDRAGIAGAARIVADLTATGFRAAATPTQHQANAADDVVTQAAQMPHGLVLLSGATGSGRTTTGYRSVEVLAGNEKRVLTVEEVVERDNPGVSQHLLGDRRPHEQRRAEDLARLSGPSCGPTRTPS